MITTRFDGFDLSLQCGRIYKDAEIYNALKKAASFGALQCGRIYKDAEILDNLALQKEYSRASMWPHL